VIGQRAILDSYGIRNDVVVGYNEVGIANLLRSGRGVILALNAGKLWGESVYVGDGGVNHAVTLTGAVYKESDGSLVGFYLTDSGRGKVSDMTRFVDIATFRQAVNVTNAYAIYTIEPVKFWQENINATGNDSANTLIGNRGDNVLSGMAGNDAMQADAGNDTLIGGAGNDTLNGGSGDDVYQFTTGAGRDVIDDSDGVDTLAFGTGVQAANVAVTRDGASLVLTVNAQDSVRINNTTGNNAVDQVKFADGTVWYAKADGSGFNASLTGSVVIQGQATQGQTLTLANTLADSDGLGTLRYQWQSSSDGAMWTNETGATSATFTLGQTQVGKALRAQVSYTDGRGNAESVTTLGSALVSNVNDAPTGTVSVSGTATQNQTLTATNTLADVDGLGSVSYQWQSSTDGVTWASITGATASTFTLGQAQVGKQVRAVASYLDGYGATESVNSQSSISVSAAAVLKITSARYVYVRKNIGTNDYLSLAEVQVLDTQGRNVAQGKSVVSGGSYDAAWHKASNLVDGSTDTATGIFASSGTNEGWVQIDLGSVQDIQNISLFGRADGWAYQDGNYTVYVSNQDMSGQTHAALQTNNAVSYFTQQGNGPIQVTVNNANQLITPQVVVPAAITSPVIPVSTSPSTITSARYVYVRKTLGVNNSLALAELQVLNSQGINIAQGKSATTSGAYDNGINGLQNLLDGKTGGNVFVDGIFATASADQGWVEVDLGSVQSISQINLFGRTDQWSSQDGNYTVYLSHSSMAGQSDSALQTNSAVSYFVQQGNGPIQVAVNAGQVVNANGLTFNGTPGSDVMSGTVSNDSLIGGAGNDTYVFSRGTGQDIIIDTDTTAGNTDVISVGAGVTNDQLWFRHVVNDLEISIIGTTDKDVIQNWYLGSQNQIEQIKTSNGKVLANTDVDKLVQAMAALTPPASGTSTLSASYQTTLAPVIAANWH
jgi:hypothetical protein